MKSIFKSCVFLSLLVNCSFASAVAPRITQDMFGQEVNADILAYQSIETNNSQATEVSVAIAKQAFETQDIQLNIDIVPSKQLAIYALFNGEVRALIGKQNDLLSFDKVNYFNLIFYVHEVENSHIPIALYIDKNAQDAEKIFLSFKQGLLSLLENQTYSDIIKKQSGVDNAINYTDLLKQYNSGGPF